MGSIRQRDVLEIVLLQTLSENETGLAPTDVYDVINDQYEFPQEWYREIPKGSAYDYLKQKGIEDWRGITQERLVQLVKTEPQWQNELRWARNELKKEGHLDTSAPRGIWKLTAKGIQAAKGISLDEFGAVEKRIISKRSSHKSKRKRGGKKEEAIVGARESLSTPETKFVYIEHYQH